MLSNPTIIAILLLCAALVLLLHHGWKHMQDPPNSPIRDESCWQCCFFQPSDISNHEVWILLCSTNAVTILLMAAAHEGC